MLQRAYNNYIYRKKVCNTEYLRNENTFCVIRKLLAPETIAFESCASSE